MPIRLFTHAAFARLHAVAQLMQLRAAPQEHDLRDEVLTVAKANALAYRAEHGTEIVPLQDEDLERGHAELEAAGITWRTLFAACDDLVELHEHLDSDAGLLEPTVTALRALARLQAAYLRALTRTLKSIPLARAGDVGR